MRPFAGDEGTTVVEFALVLPVVLLLLVGVLDLARAVNAYVCVSEGSREGARYAIVHPTASPSAIAAAVRQRTAPLDGSQVSVDVTYYDGATFRPWPAPAPSPRPTAIPVRVSVAYPWSGATFLLGAFFGAGGDRTFGASSTMDELR